jgi:hypothetical protein
MKQKGWTMFRFVSGWVIANRLYTTEDWPSGTNSSAMIDVACVGPHMLFPDRIHGDLGDVEKTIRSKYPKLIDGDFTVYSIKNDPQKPRLPDGSQRNKHSHLIEITRKDDWLPIVIFKVLRTDVDVPSCAIIKK